MKQQIHTAGLIAACTVLTAAGAAQGPLDTDRPSQRSAAHADRSGPNRAVWTERRGGEPITVEGTIRPEHQPEFGYSAARRAGELERAELRQKLNWGDLSREAQDALWHKAVGPDQIDPEGINLVTFGWAYTKSIRGEDHEANDLVLNYDGDVVLVGSDLGTDSDPSDYSRFFVTELEGTANASDGWTENWERGALYNQNGTGYVSGEQAAVDFRGSTYVCGKRSDGRFTVWKFSGVTIPGEIDEGETIWRNSVAVTRGTDAVANDIAVDPEGTVYVSGFYTGLLGKSTFIARLDQDTGSLDWLVEPPIDGRPIGGIEFDRKGDLFIGGETNGGHVIGKLRALDGSVVWVQGRPAGENTAKFIDTLRLDGEGDVYFTAQADGPNNGWMTSKWDGETGNRLWTTTTDSGQPENLEVDEHGNVYVCGDSDTKTFVLRKYDTDGNLIWTYETGTTGGATEVALDRLGNPYMAGGFGGGSNTHKVQTSKHDPDDGSLVWEMIDTPDRPGETNIGMRTRDLIVDAGGGVYVAGDRLGRNDNSGNTGEEFFLLKYEQPYLSIPQITRSYPQVSIEGRSLWDPDGSLGIDGFEYSRELFSLKASDVISTSQINDRLSAKVDYGLGVIEGGVKIGSNFNGEVRVTLDAAASGGTFDASTTGELAIAIPGEAELFATQDFDIVLNWDADEFGTDLLSNAEPRLNAGINAQSFGTINADLEIKKGNGSTIVDTGIKNANLGMGPYQMFGVDFVNLPPAGTWYDPVDYPWSRFFNGKIRSPLLKTEGAFDESTNVISSSLRSKFLEAKIRLTEILLALSGSNPLNINWGAPAGANGYDAEVDAGLIQADIDGSLFLLQDLDLEMRPYVVLEFNSDGDTVPESVRVEFYDNQGDPVNQRTVTVRLPDNGELEITPSFGVDATMTNSSGLEIQLTAGFDVARFELAASALDVDLIDIDKCIGCSEETESFEVRNTDLGIPNISEQFSFPNEHELAPIRVFGDANLQPQLIGASRESARMLIYNQRSPSLSDFNDFTGGTSPMILYGYKFFSGQSTTVKISHHGRTESLTRTRLNDQAILIEVPNRFFLLPGIARLWVENNNGISESIDLAIEYPFPNFEGIEEVFWASDNRWAEESIVVVDGGTPSGNDSFIARRDYYEYLQSNLWNAAILSDLNDPNQSASDYFATFAGWAAIGAEPATPGFPAMTFEGVSLPREQVAVPDGKFRVRVPEEIVSKSGFKLLALCNPGPGGGMSRVRAIEVPAPRPVVSGVSPNIFQPGNVDADDQGRVRVSITGPDSVPFFDGYEAPKYGNFTPRSVVQIDGNAVPTEFISSGELIARIPVQAFNIFGRRVVEVVTPNPRGTRYPEELIDGNGNQVSAGLVPSGGRSDPYMIDVLWPRPEVDFVSHKTIEVGQPPFFPVAVDDMPPPDDHNVTILGENFAPGCTVFLDGVRIPATRDTDSVIRATLTSGDVGVIGTPSIVVRNPSPSVRTSVPYEIEVVPPAP